MISFSLRKHFGSMHLSAEGTFSKERIVLSGDNGSGKTTMLRLLAGLEVPDQGSIHFYDHTWVDAEKSYVLPVHKRKAACVFVQPSLLPWLNVYENISIGLPEEKRYAARDTMASVIRTLKLTEFMSKSVRHLSAGEAQRVALARAFMCEPKLLLLDEPFSAQSPKMRIYLQQWLIELHDALRFPMVLVTHDKAEAEIIAERRWHMRNGNLIALESVRKKKITEWV